MIRITELTQDQLSFNLHPAKILSDDIYKLVEKTWSEKTNPHLFNGNIFSVTQIKNTVIEGFITEYKFYLAQRKYPQLKPQLNIRPLAISGILECEAGLIYGLRSKNTTQTPDCWELIPSGSIDCENKTIDYEGQLYKELEEELGLTSNDIDATKTCAIIEDTNENVFDIVMHLSTNLSFDAIKTRYTQLDNPEYSEIKLVKKNEIEQFTQNNKVIEVSSVITTLL